LPFTGDCFPSADIERESRAAEALTSEVLADLPPDQQSLVRDLLKALDAASADDAARLEASERTPPRLGGRDDDEIFQSELFAEAPLMSAKGVVQPRDFYTRFKLSEWHAHKDHRPQPTPNLPSSSPSVLPPPRRDEGKPRSRAT
jgi:hypothetical protein